MGYYILQRPGPLPGNLSGDSPNEVERLRAQLADGDPEARGAALQRLVGLQAEDALVECLSSASPEVVRLATAGLWECWLNEAGTAARRQLEEGIEAMNAGDLDAASHRFDQLMTEYPNWAEAANKQASVLYMMGEPQRSIEVCQRVVTMKPDHFGAWNGLAICALQTEDWSLALHAVQESLRLMPHSRANQQLLRLMETRLPQV